VKQNVADYRVDEEEDYHQPEEALKNLQNNPDFQQLLNMMDFAKQLQAPLNLFGGEGGLSLSSPAFAPAKQRSQEESKQKEESKEQ